MDGQLPFGLEWPAVALRRRAGQAPMAWKAAGKASGRVVWAKI